jgi:Terminase large subunit, T4likevirus-type, N-terminal
LIVKRLRRLRAETAALTLRAEAARPGSEPEWARRYRQDPSLVLGDSGIPPDPWQAAVLRSDAPRVLMCCCRQTGKSTTAGALALAAALLEPFALVLILSASERQAGEFFYKHVRSLYDRLPGPTVPIERESALQLHLANGSRVIALPTSEATIRGYSGVTLLVIDEAARVGDDLIHSVSPMLAVSRGRLVCLTTPFGKRGWFFEEWEHAENARRSGKQPDFETYRITADECPRITPEFLAKERRGMGERWFRQEYYCSFEDTVDAVFSFEDVQAALSDQLEAWAM